MIFARCRQLTTWQTGQLATQRRFDFYVMWGIDENSAIDDCTREKDKSSPRLVGGKYPTKNRKQVKVDEVTGKHTSLPCDSPQRLRTGYILHATHHIVSSLTSFVGAFVETIWQGDYMHIAMKYTPTACLCSHVTERRSPYWIYGKWRIHGVDFHNLLPSCFYHYLCGLKSRLLVLKLFL